MFHSSQGESVLKQEIKIQASIWNLSNGQGPSFNDNSNFCGKR